MTTTLIEPMEIAGQLPDHEGRLVPCVTLEQAEGYAQQFAEACVEEARRRTEGIVVDAANEMYLRQHPRGER